MKTSRILVLLLLFACNHEGTRLVKSDDYIQWIRNPQNELHQTKKVESLVLSLQYLPSEYFTITHQSTFRTNKVDSFSYNSQLTFSLTVDIDKQSSVSLDPFFINANSMSEVEERKQKFAETIEQNSYIICNSKRFSPVISVDDISNGLVKSKTVLLAFDKPSDYAQGGFEFVWNDMTFHTGIHRFSYTQDVLSNIPKIDRGLQ